LSRQWRKVRAFEGDEAHVLVNVQNVLGGVK
jgi:hypothetical protein